MRPENRKTSANLVELRAAYEFEWRRLLAEVERWQSLQEGDRVSAVAIRQAEACARAAHERYRGARNALAECLAARSERRGLPAIDSPRAYALTVQTAAARQ